MKKETVASSYAEVYKQFKESGFYEKYKDSYFADCILKRVFGEDINITGYPLQNKTYEDVYNKMVQVMGDFFELYYEQALRDEYRAWLMIYSFYIDPDFSSIKKNQDIECTADGILSLKRIFSYTGATYKLVEEYQKYRRIPTIHFPREKNGINMSRVAVFGDRIDHTLLDIKNFLDPNNRDSAKMTFAFSQPKTAAWLANMGTFEKVIDWLGIKGIFTNDNDEIFDLEKNDGSILDCYLERYPYEWSDKYYENIKSKIMEYMEPSRL